MVSRRAIQLKDRTVLFSPDDPVPSVDRIQALVKLRITDELTSKPPLDTRITLDVREWAFVSRVASDGLAGLVGIPRLVFPALQTTDYVIHLTVNAERYLARELEVKVLKNPGFPNSFSAPQIAVALHREPVFISGRTVRSDGNASTPLGGSQVSVTGIWRTPPPANSSVPAHPADLVSLQPPLYADHAVADILRRKNLLPVTGNDKTLTDDLPSGADVFRLSNRLGLSLGDLLLIDAEQPDLVEFIAIKTLPTTAPADQPTVITLEHHLAFAHRRNALVRPINPQPAGVNRQLTVEAWSGDSCVFLDALTGLAATNQIEIAGGPKPEYHSLLSFAVTSDAEGYYRLPPLNRVAQLEIHAEKTVGAQTFKTTTTFRPDYQYRENRLDFMMAV